MRSPRLFIAILAGLVTGIAPTSALAQPFAEPQSEGILTPVGQLLRPEGDALELPAARPVDAVIHPSGRTLYIKTNGGLLVVDVQAWSILQEFDIAAGGSMSGLALHAASAKLYVTDAGSALLEADIADDGRLTLGRTIQLPAPAVGGNAFGCGVALSADAATAVVCLSRGNAVAVVDLKSNTVARTIDVGVAPYAVALSPDATVAYVTNWGGRRTKEGDLTASSAGTPAVVDKRGVAASGTLSVIDLSAGTTLSETEVGLQPSALTLTRDGAMLYIATSNSDTVVEYDTAARAIKRRIDVKPDPSLPYGSMPAALVLSDDDKTLYVANAGNNAIAVIPLASADEARPAGFIPTAWLPGALARHENRLFVACIRGLGSRVARDADRAFNSHRHLGTVHRLDIPDRERLGELTRRALDDARVPAALASLERARTGVAPAPVPARAGEPSPVEHCVYIIKENRTYDQVFGDFADGENPKGRGMPKLCIFGRDITPNHHALADQYVLLDNYYCNGVLSADGHSWATEGNSTTYLERSFGAFARSYTFGDDPLTYSASGFIWDRVLAAGLSFRNYGEFDYTDETPDSSFPEIWADWQQARAAGGGERKIKFNHRIGVETMRRYGCPDAPGWNMDIPDQIRADVFLDELKTFEEKGGFPSLVIIYLPNDHTSGTDPGNPTPRALVADNDLALGRIVEGLTRSKFWPKMAIFVNEDDPQDGWDHVDGHRSICLVVSPYAKRNQVVSVFYNQATVIHTIERILGVTATNQRYGMMPVMTDCFTAEPDLSPFTALQSKVSITEMNPKRDALGPAERHWADVSMRQNFKRVDAADEDDLNRVLWHAMKGVDAPYPAEFAGAHGRGLAALGLRFGGETGLERDDLFDDSFGGRSMPETPGVR